MRINFNPLIRPIFFFFAFQFISSTATVRLLIHIVDAIKKLFSDSDRHCGCDFYEINYLHPACGLNFCQISRPFWWFYRRFCGRIPCKKRVFIPEVDFEIEILHTNPSTHIDFTYIRCGRNSTWVKIFPGFFLKYMRPLNLRKKNVNKAWKIRNFRNKIR
jgi:hypothetical protein